MDTPKDENTYMSGSDSNSESDEYFSDDDIIHKLHNLNSPPNFSRNYCSDTELYNTDDTVSDTNSCSSSDTNSYSSSDSGSSSSDPDSSSDEEDDDELLRVIHLPMEKLI
jgi:hypothetical protein